MLTIAFFMGLANGVMTRVINGLFGVMGMELAGEGEWNLDGVGTEIIIGVSLFVLGLVISLISFPKNPKNEIRTN